MDESRNFVTISEEPPVDETPKVELKPMVKARGPGGQMAPPETCQRLSSSINLVDDD